ncbi:hypothetical protein RhiirA5_437660 [Rhizophagus irregularis]|uniref:Uncharacterized protein n=1 Tax=Rhizophagus irregularis TaxID=588596 RepID=A0A2N0NK73_9GLOM|nr:hypothetical protein RhiirA5_437660 [Rhizophagus irregularis]
MANILIKFILAFKELIWKPRCEQRADASYDRLAAELYARNNTEHNQGCIFDPKILAAIRIQPNWITISNTTID